MIQQNKTKCMTISLRVDPRDLLVITQFMQKHGMPLVGRSHICSVAMEMLADILQNNGHRYESDLTTAIHLLHTTGIYMKAREASRKQLAEAMQGYEPIMTPQQQEDQPETLQDRIDNITRMLEETQ